MILVVGSTGLVGSEICRKISEQKRPVRALVRISSDTSKKDGLRSMGVELVEGDLLLPDTLSRTLDGVDTVIATASSMPFSYVPGENDIRHLDMDGMLALIEEARRAGVNRFIYTSFSAHIDLDFPLNQAKRAVEDRLIHSGMTYTILRPSYFMEVWLSPATGFDFQHTSVQIRGEGTEPVSYISYHDVATLAVECIDHPAAVNTILELGGPEEISPLDAVHVFETVAGKPFEIETVSEEELLRRMHEAPDPMQQSFAGLMACVAHGDPIDMTVTAERFHIDLKTVREYAQEVLSAI